MINIGNVVKVDFKIFKSNSVIGSYKTVVYLVPDTLTINDEEKKAVLCTSQDEVLSIEGLSDEIKYNTQQFFNNGGVQLILVKASAYTLQGFKSDIESARALSNDFIYVTINNTICDVVSEESGYTSAVVLEIAKWIETLKSPETIRLLLTKNIKSSEDTPTYNYEYIDAFKNLSVGIKFCSKQLNGKVIDAALLIGTYFTQINLDTSNAIKDYCYTSEEILSEKVVSDEETGLSYIETTNIASEDVAQSVYSKLVARNYNFIDTIGNNIINFGGNLSNGVSLSTDFATVCSENDICNAALSNMLNKQYLSEAGLTNLISAITKQLLRYKNNGYIRINSTYSGEDLYINYNNKNYNVIKNGNNLSQGFLVFAVPVSDISVKDRNEKRFPPIYVVIESLAGARTIEISGEVR